MELRSSRLTRAASARLEQTLHASGESTTPRLKSNWFRIMDAKISGRLGIGTTKKNTAAEEMAPGGTLIKKKVLFTPNRTSLGYMSRNVPGLQTGGNVPRVQSDGTNEASPTETVVPSVRRRTGPAAPSSGHQTKSTDGQTQSTGRQNKSSRQQTQPQCPPTMSASNRTQPSSPKASKSVISKQQSSVTPTEPTDLINDVIDHLRDETTETTEDASHESDETVAISSSEPKRKRGPTMGKGLIKEISGSNGKKLKVEVDPTIGRPKNRVQSAKFSSQVGVVTRNVLPIPKKWKDVDVQTALEPCFDHMQIHMELNMDKPGVKQSLIERLKNSSRQQRHRLHVHFKRFANVEEAKRNKPASVTDQEAWDLLCDHFDSPKFKHQSEANTKNRKQMQAKHVTGRTPFTIIQNEITIKNGKECDMIELYKSTHQNADGEWSSTVAKKNWESMNESLEKYAAEGIDITEEEIAADVLGKANGYIKGRGYGPKPPGKRSANLQQQLDDAQAELEEARTDNAAYKNKVDAMTEQLSKHAEQITKLMAFIDARGRGSFDEDVDEDADDD